MKIAWFKENISPEIGTLIAGYAYNDVSVVKHDDLFMTGLCLDDGKNKALIISSDIIALDGFYIRDMRKKCAEILQTSEEMIFFSCTHNHSGPETATPGVRPENLNKPYLEKFTAKILDNIAKLKDFKECIVTFYSAQCDVNMNRRYTTPDNVASFMPHRRELRAMANGFADKELGVVAFLDIENKNPVYIIGNYAAHPLAGHSPGIGGLRISADFPGFFRDYITHETGAEAMFITGAAGDMVPREDEMGIDGARNTGVALAKEAIGSVIDIQRNPARFHLQSPVLGGDIRSFTTPIRKQYIGKIPPEYAGKNDVTLEIQTLAIGDICFVGVPGEVCAELGQEIKWHSPFRRAFIAYYSTADFSYIAPGNFLVSGGYEGLAQQFSARGSLLLVNTAVESMYDLREKIYPSSGDEAYPDYLIHKLVDIPAN